MCVLTKRQSRTLFLLLAWLWQEAVASPPDELVIGARGKVSLGQHLQYAVDPGGHVSIANLLRQPGLLDWRKSTADVPSFGFSSDPYWLRSRLRLRGAAAETWLLQIDYALLNHVDIYQIVNHSVERHFALGDQLPFSQRPIPHHSFLAPLRLRPGEPVELMIRVRTGGAMQVPAVLWRPEIFHARNELVALGRGAFYGALFVLLAYNLFLYLSLREAAYVYYALYVAALGFVQAGLDGFTFQYLWPESLWWQLNSTPFFVAVTLGFAVLFVHRFLDLRHHWPAAARLLDYLIWTVAVLGVVGLALPYRLTARVDVAIVAPYVATLFVVSLLSWWRGQPAARLLLIAWAAFLIGALLMALNKFGFVPRNLFTENAMQVGFFAEAILLSLALSDRINHERNRHEAAQARALALQEQARAELEKRVDERTQSLHETMVKLENANTRLSSLSTTDPLTGVGNRRFFDQRLADEWERGARTALPLSLLMIDVDHFKRLNDAHGHQAGDACLVELACCTRQQVARANDIVARYGGEEFVVILPHTSLLDATLVGKRIHQAVMELPIPVDGDVLHLTVSIGVACCVPGHELQPDDLIAAADRALYQAKREGRNRVCIQESVPAV